MNITSRQENILKLVGEYKYISVRKLAELTYTSPSSIRRDLARLENMCFVKRTHGGVQSMEESNLPPNFKSRVSQNAVLKRKIAQNAVRFLHNSQCIMLDSSSTAGYLLPHIAKFNDITLFTNNMITALNAINYGISTYCIGGHAYKNSPVLSGEETYKILESIHPDVVFFSSFGLDSDGNITDPTPEENYARAIMLKNSAQSVFLCDSEKFDRRSVYSLTSADKVTACVFDERYAKLKCKCHVVC